MRALFAALVLAGCTETEPPYPDLEITSAEIHLVDAQIVGLRFGFTLDGPYVDHGHVVASASIVEVVAEQGGGEGWISTPLDLHFQLGDDRWRPFDEMTLEDHGTDAAVIEPFCNRSMKIVLNASAEAIGDFHLEGSSAELDGVPIVCE